VCHGSDRRAKFKADTPHDALQKASDNLLVLKGEFIIACAHPQRCFVCVRAVRAFREYAEYVVPIFGGKTTHPHYRFHITDFEIDTFQDQEWSINNVSSSSKSTAGAPTVVELTFVFLRVTFRGSP
jgi:hypothetical protein